MVSKSEVKFYNRLKKGIIFFRQEFRKVQLIALNYDIIAKIIFLKFILMVELCSMTIFLR